MAKDTLLLLITLAALQREVTWVLDDVIAVSGVQ
jgi:hypothetical protein